MLSFYSPTPKPTWYHNGKEISEETDEGFRFESYGKTLVFNVTHDKAGKYDCRFPVHNDIDRTFNVVVEASQLTVRIASEVDCSVENNTEYFGVLLNLLNSVMAKVARHNMLIFNLLENEKIFKIKDVCISAAPYWPDGPPPNTNTSEGETVTFDCTTSGKPTPKVTFYKNGVGEFLQSYYSYFLLLQFNFFSIKMFLAFPCNLIPLMLSEMKKPKDGDKWVIEANRLTIYDVKKGIHGKGDNAVYQCKAENKHGYVWTNFYLNLLAFKPQLLTDSGEVEAVVGQSVTLECKFFGSPNAVITWSSPVLQGIVSNVIPANPHGVGKLVIPTFKPQLLTDSGEVEAVVGQSVTLECKFFGSPNAVITWSSPVLQGIVSNVIPANPHGVGKLVIPNVTPDAEGEYECTGTNKYGHAKGAAKLLVRKATRLEPFRRSEEMKIAGETIRLPCEATPDERLDVKYEWLVNGQPLSNVHLQSGHYKADVPVPVHAAYVSKCDADSQSAEITFEHMEPADTISPVKEFWVQYQMDSETEGTQWRTHPVPVQAHPNDRIEGDERVVNGKATVALQPFGHYVFRVLARNGVGDSSPTRVRDVCITPPKKPDRNPSGVWAKGASPENIVVHWRPMAREEWNGRDFHYKIRYRPYEGDDGEWKEVQVNDPFASRYTITLDDDVDTKPFRPYEVQVQAVNEKGQANIQPETIKGYSGEGVPSSIPSGFRVLSKVSPFSSISKTVQIYPILHLNFKDGTSVTFAWNAVDPRTANGNFTGYKITYWYDENDNSDDENGIDETRLLFRRSIKSIKKRNAEAKKHTVVFGPKATFGTITDLQPDTDNYATIQVVNGAHEGEPSAVIQFRTDEGVPSPVRSLRAYPMNARDSDEKAIVHLIWRKPRRPNGRLLYYTIMDCRTENGRIIEKDCPKQQVNSDRTQIRISGLQFETPYRFIVRAQTNAGEGDPNSVDVTTLPEVVASGGENTLLLKYLL
ncbi:fibronectin type III domain protein [Dictyocaulus viviparus]|uniref:Fibronectin type III domain protein n=1 Tax=Dictyocaulus viviparus TaxID=29172 RepID=A0A0D8Y5M0_DICVI|nr:fibronectin type III domain protein [Dictyocaulus viviparus]